MASVDLLGELKLNDYYPQKLSFSEAIKLLERSQNGCQEQYGLNIVRKLLMFDSTAVVSVTTEINDRLNNTFDTETETRVQNHSDGVRPPRKSSVRPSRRSDKAEQNERKFHPMDMLVVVMNCCDDFLRQVLVEKMFANKLSIPILLPSVRNDSYTLLLLALRSLVSEVHDGIREDSDCLTDTLVDIKNPVVSFIRVGDLHRSKSKLVNELLNLSSFNTFFHSECQNGSAKRLVSNGSIEAAWFQSETEDEFNCRFFTALNLRGNAKEYPKQTQFLCQLSTLVVFMVDSFESFKELYENVLKDADVPQAKIIVCYISRESPDQVDERNVEFLDDLSLISAVIYDWNDGNNMSDIDLTNDLRKTISEYSKPGHICSNQTPTYANISRSGQKYGFLLDENKLECKLVKSSADEFVDLVLKQPPDCKPKILPLQGEPWGKIGKLEREQRGISLDNNKEEHFIAIKETEKRRQREIQCRRLIEQNEVTLKFCLKLDTMQEPSLSYYLNSCKIKLNARSRVIISNLIKEEAKEKQESLHKLSNKGEADIQLSQMELNIANSAIGLEHILRECGQMYEAVISEEIRLREELKNAALTPAVIRNLPSIVARLLLMGQPLELMDGDTSNVPITWLKTVLAQIRSMTNNAKVFVLSIIGVQSSGKSTLLNALFGLQFPVSARGIYCHLVPVDKESLNAECDYVLVVDTEGLGSSQFPGKSTFRDIELATFAIGLADATIINMKGENWSEMHDILQIVAHCLIRVRKTKAELELMPRCMFVHQNVPAIDAEEKNRMGQEKQLMLLDTAIKEAGREEGFTEITKFNQVIRYDPESHSWYFPNLWNGRPPKARVSQDYIGKVNELKQHLIQVMKDSPSKLTISGFFLRMSDLWNAMLHNDFVLCFRNTQETISGTVLNDRISHEVGNFKYLNKLEQTKFRELICSFKSFEEFSAQKDRILMEVSDAVEKNFTNMKATLQNVIDASGGICAELRHKYEITLNVQKEEETHRINDESAKDISVHIKKLQYDSDQRVKDLRARLAGLEKCLFEAEIAELNETTVKEFEGKWQHLIDENKVLVIERTKLVENKIKETICQSLKKLSQEDELHLETVERSELFKAHLVAEMPQVTENDIVQNKTKNSLSSWEMDSEHSKSHVYKAMSSLHDAHKKWELQFHDQRGLEFNASHLEQVMLEVGQLLGILAEEHYEVRTGAGEIGSCLPPGYSFTSEYISRLIKFVCHYTYNRSLENSKRFISLTDPLADIDERYLRFVSHYRLMTVETNINAVSKQIFDYAVRSFVRNLGELIKTKVWKEENENPTFKSKRAFLREILRDLGQRTHNLTHANKGKDSIFEEFMLYFEFAESKASEDFFLVVILKLLTEMLTKENESETDFQKMVKNNVGTTIEKIKSSLRHAEIKCKGCAGEYVRIFKEQMNVTSEIGFRINTLDGFTDFVLHKIDNLYADFLSHANSSFETLVCTEDRAGIRPLFEKIMGCREKCPFCSAPCSQSLELHAGDHRANHYPTGVGGTIEIIGFFANTLETVDAIEGHRNLGKLSLCACETLVRTRTVIRTKVTVQKYNKWYHRVFFWNYPSLRNYKELEEYENWDIPYSQNHNASLYWRWFMAQFVKELAKHYKALSPKILESWQRVTWEEAHQSLDD